jgi:hypothetical protein
MPWVITEISPEGVKAKTRNHADTCIFLPAILAGVCMEFSHPVQRGGETLKRNGHEAS